MPEPRVSIYDNPAEVIVIAYTWTNGNASGGRREAFLRRRTIPELLGLGVLRRRLTRRTPAAVTPPGLDRPASRNPSDPVEAQ